MKSKSAVWIVLGLMSGWSAMATNVYVVPPGTPGATPSAPYTSWDTAATNIADAVNAINITDGNIVFISNGTYKLSDEIVVDKGVVLRSWNDGQTDRDGTIIDGNNYEGKPVTNRVISLKHAEAVLDGLTIRGGQLIANHGAGIAMFQSLMITNCAIVSNVGMGRYGGGIWVPGNREVGVITHCLIASNIASQGGGVFFADSATGRVEYCQILTNQATDASNLGGGGIQVNRGGDGNVVARNCLIAHNSSGGSGGGVSLLYSGVIENCLIVSNYAAGTSAFPGAGVVLYNNGIAGVPVLRNCLVQGNTGAIGKGAVGVWVGSALPCNEVAAHIENCTIVDNPNVRGYYRKNNGSPTSEAHVVNTIIYGHELDMHTYTRTYFTNCLSSIALPGENNITNVAPTFVDGYRLASDSAGVNDGLNQAWMTESGVKDLDGKTRIDRFSGKVDMGCYEYLPRGTAFSLR